MIPALLAAAALAAPPAPALLAAYDLPTDGPAAERLSVILDSRKTRAFYADGLAHRADYAPLVDGALADAGLPAWLAAVPLVESGYTNLGAPDALEILSRAPGIPGRGLWMFIPDTAREYGLRVDVTADERLDPVRETGAAVDLLSDLHDRYGDWNLALAAYNQGPKVVDAAITAHGSRDAWTLIDAGALNGYVAEVWAAVILLDHPELTR